MSTSRTVRVSTLPSGNLVSHQYSGRGRHWEVLYLDPVNGTIEDFALSCNTGVSPKQVLESMGVPYDFGVEVRFV